jgi:(p)ppGpp synthase/HD superfamily hydrolase
VIRIYQARLGTGIANNKPKERKMNLIDISLKIAIEAHEGQIDKAGKPYILHPIRLMLKMKDDKALSAAILHDVVEDSDITEEDLRNRGIPDDVIDAVLCLTKRENESYDVFLERVLKNNIATIVKIADIEDNMNILRLQNLSDYDLKRLKKYHRAWKKLKANRG